MELESRIGTLTDAFERAFGAQPDGVWLAPGRVNLIGEHTDYNDGFVLPLALEQSCLLAASRSGQPRSVVWSLQQPSCQEFAIGELSPGQPDGWAGYLAGVLWALREAGHTPPDVHLVLDSDVPAGAGLSSSAALECAVALAVRDLAELPIERTELAVLARTAENEFVGAPTGIMDQIASLFGREGHLVHLDTRTLHMQPIPFDLARHGLALLVVDTRAPHALVSGQYAARRQACEAGAELLGVAALRDVPQDELDEALSRIDYPVIARRVRHVVTENDRVTRVSDMLRSGYDPRDTGELLTASHRSLQHDFEVSIPHLDVAVDAALAAGAYGARMTGGGFGGSVIALIDADRVETTHEAVAEASDAAGFAEPVCFTVAPAQGARRLA